MSGSGFAAAFMSNTSTDRIRAILGHPSYQLAAHPGARARAARIV